MDTKTRTTSAFCAFLRSFLAAKKFIFSFLKNVATFLQSRCRKQKIAFTLAELLTAILIISIIMVALAPVITKRMQENISVVTDNKKGEEVWTNPGSYIFSVPIGINTLEISGAGGGGGGAGAVSKSYSKTYEGAATRTITVPKGVGQITFTLVGAGGGGGGANAKTKGDPCKYPLTIPSMADSGKDLCVSNFDPPITGEGHVSILTIGTTTVRNNGCWIATADRNTAGACSATSWPSSSPYFSGGGCKKMACTHEGATAFCAHITHIFTNHTGTGECDGGITGCARPLSYRLFSLEELKRLSDASTASNQYKWLFGKGLDLGMHQYVIGLPYTMANESFGCTSPSQSVCSVYRLFATNGSMSILDRYYGSLVPRFEPEGPWFNYGSISGTAQVRCVRELDNWDQYSGAGGATGAKLTKTIKVQPGDTLTIVTGAGGSGGAKAGGTGGQGGSTCLEHKRNGVRYTDPTNTINNGYYCAYGGYGGKGATTSAHGSPNSTLAECSHSAGCTKSTNGASGGSSQGGRGANGAEGATADTGQGNAAGVGFDSTAVSSGGGGGYCPRGNRSPSGCQKGGKGGAGSFTISFNQFVSGGGGGAGGAAGTYKDGNYHPIKLKIKEGETLTFTIGAGGMGGAFATNGEDGQDTIVSTKNNPEVFTFRGAKGGTVGTFNGTCAYDTLGCGKGGAGGIGGRYPNYASSPGSFPYLNPPATASGKTGSLDTKGFWGGSGGATVLSPVTTCGGYEVDEATSCEKYDPDGNSAQRHNPITNLLGGQGGAGAGNDGLVGGVGGSGGAGYIRVKWDASTQE